VVGSTSEAGDATLRAVYAPVLETGTPYLATDLATAELVKVAANAFLATKISFINAVATVCDAAGADVGRPVAKLSTQTAASQRAIMASHRWEPRKPAPLSPQLSYSPQGTPAHISAQAPQFSYALGSAGAGGTTTIMVRITGPVPSLR
jgi:UDP-glucose/GDP-mannose dehydrogenase family, central domain